MDSILELEPSQIAHIKDTLVESKVFFKEHAASLFEDCFLAITSSQAKPDNFKLMR